jgi:N6-adenosine-specific RNA methylase IME4
VLDRTRWKHDGLTLPGLLTATSWTVPSMTMDEWIECGRVLDKVETGAAWWRGDWWNAHGYGEKAFVAEDAGTSYQRFANCGWVCKRFEFSRRRENLTFYHHEVVAALPHRQQDKWLDQAEIKGWSGNKLHFVIRQLAAVAKTQQIDLDAKRLGKYAVIYADPPWQLGKSPGTSRATENHYPTMPIDQICLLPVPDIMHDNAVMFLWVVSPLLPECLSVLKAWDLECVTTAVWVKDKFGLGSYFRQQHEIMLVAKRGDMPPPAPELRPASVIEAPRLEHSAKPPVVYDLIDRMYPGIRKIELFGRWTKKRALWTAWGNQAGTEAVKSLKEVGA